MRNISFLLILMVAFGVRAEDPAWIYSGVIAEYQDQRFITALGEGSSSEEAGKQAYARLAEQVKISISSQSNIVQEYRSTLGKVEKDENVDIQIRTQVDLNDIEGIQIVARHHQAESGTYYALAVLNKTKTASQLDFKIENQFEHIRNQLVSIKADISKGDASLGITKLSKASQQFRDIVKSIELHQLFGKSGSTSLLRDEMFELIGEFDRYLVSIYPLISVSSPGGSEKSGSPELGVSEPYRVNFSFNGYALKHIPVKVLADSVKANIDSDDSTDDQGNLSVMVRSLPYTGKQANKIRVGLDLYEDLFTQPAPGTDLVVMLSQKSEVSIRLVTVVRSESHDFLDLIVNDGLSSLLSSQNYQVLGEDDDPSNKVDYILESKCKVIDYPGIGSMRFSKISGVIRIKSGKSGRVIKTIRIDDEATKAGALSNSDAAEKAAGQMVNVVKRELLSTLEKNLGRS